MSWWLLCSWSGVKLEWGKSIDANNCLVAVKATDAEKVEEETKKFQTEADRLATDLQAARSKVLSDTELLASFEVKAAQRKADLAWLRAKVKQTSAALVAATTAHTVAKAAVLSTGTVPSVGDANENQSSAQNAQHNEDPNVLDLPTQPRLQQLDFLERYVCKCC